MQTRAEKLSKIAELNDLFRQTFWGGQVLMTPGSMALSEATICKIFSAVQNFEDFNKDNDPHGQRDFGKFEINGLALIWKIDYYDNTLKGYSPNPAIPLVTTRVMTIMLADEY